MQGSLHWHSVLRRDPPVRLRLLQRLLLRLLRRLRLLGRLRPVRAGPIRLAPACAHRLAMLVRLVLVRLVLVAMTRLSVLDPGRRIPEDRYGQGQDGNHPAGLTGIQPHGSAEPAGQPSDDDETQPVGNRELGGRGLGDHVIGVSEVGGRHAEPVVDDDDVDPSRCADDVHLDAGLRSGEAGRVLQQLGQQVRGDHDVPGLDLGIDPRLEVDPRVLLDLADSGPEHVGQSQGLP